jgi:hypothetical protein
MIREASVGKGGEESSGGKRPYEASRVLGLRALDEGHGAPTQCQSGSGEFGTCANGDVASAYCSQGAAAV